MILRDPVHGLISFAPRSDGLIDAGQSALLTDLLDCPEVQRLRRIRALGLASLVYPGGEHSRFAHAVGAAHVMIKWLERLTELEREIDVSLRCDPFDRAAAMAAALLHDLGHGPYSHTFEDLHPSASRHETWTSRIVMSPETRVHQVLRAYSSQLPAAVEALIRGESHRPALATAVCGTFDVDRCDYLLRDSHMTGVRYGSLDIPWLFASLRLRPAVGTQGPTLRLAVDGEKGLTAIESFFLARLYMYRQVYFHKAVRAAEVVLQQLFSRIAAKGIDIPLPLGLRAFVRGEEMDLADFLALDDRALDTMLFELAQGNDPVAASLARSLRHRRLFKTISLRSDVNPVQAQAALDAALQQQGHEQEPALGSIDRVEIRSAFDLEELMVVHGDGRLENLASASVVLRALAAQRIVTVRAIVPAHLRQRCTEALASFV